MFFEVLVQRTNIRFECLINLRAYPPQAEFEHNNFSFFNGSRNAAPKFFIVFDSPLFVTERASLYIYRRTTS
jgi:hypothetical protein